MEARIQVIALRLFVMQFKAFTVTKFNNIFASWQLRQVAEWRVKLCLKAIYAFITTEMILPNSSYYGTSFILNVSRFKPTATHCNIQKLHFPHKCVSIFLLCIISTMSS